MQSGRRAQKIGFTAKCRTLGAVNAQAGACRSHSDSMVEDFRVPSKSNNEGRRQRQQAGLRGAKIPCLQAPYNTQCFLLGNQLLAATSEDHLRRLNFIFPCPEKAGVEMATLSHFCASLLYGVFSASKYQTENTVSMANPEV